VSAAALTSGRIPYATTGGAITDSANLTFNGSALAVTGTLSATGTTTLRTTSLRDTTPEADNAYTLGSGSLRWGDFYSALGRFSRARSNSAGDCTLFVTPSDTTVQYGLRVNSANNNLNFDYYGGSWSTPLILTATGDLLLGTATGGIGGGLTVVSTKYIYSLGTYNNTTASAANMFVDSAAGVFARSTSALKYKRDIRDLEPVNIFAFRPVRYKSKCENDDPNRDHIGIIADEVHEAGITELVNYSVDGEVEGFQYERLTVVLLKELQTLRAEFDAYKAAHP
jgi:hypothetical protein